jgi:hypothetical protein
MKAIEEMQYEQRYLQELRGELSDEEEKKEDDEEVGEDGELKPAKLSEHEEFEKKVAENAEEGARHYFSLLQATKKEYKILQKQQDILKEKYISQRDKLEEVNAELIQRNEEKLKEA